MSSVRAQRDVTGWVGWVWFASIVMITNGCFNVIDGLVALFRDRVYVQGRQGLVVWDFTTWGWILLITGIIQIIVALTLLRGQIWARIAAVTLAMFSAVSQIAFIPAFPFWSLVIIGLDIVVIWAVLVHGDEARCIFARAAFAGFYV